MPALQHMARMATLSKEVLSRALEGESLRLKSVFPIEILIRTGNKSSSCLERGESARIDDVSHNPMTRMSPHFVIDESKCTERYAGVEGFEAVAKGIQKTDRYQRPAEDERITECHAPSRKWTIALVLLILFGTKGLVRDIELEKMNPNPTYRMEDICRLQIGRGCHGKAGLEKPIRSVVRSRTVEMRTMGIRVVLRSDFVNRYIVYACFQNSLNISQAPPHRRGLVRS